ncbi:MAG TPA: D-2-hydroxyacid dehydrogenase [Candidatus Angelobacter sp.]|jgi:glycerate dehydrogenase|nr:D-2-hydroxyacid dehydrogenase [Candidatus Angelobacter sp.]
MIHSSIVVLDGHTLNPGDLSWAGLEALGEFQVHERTPADLVVHRCQGAAIVLTNKTVLKGETIRALPDLRFIGVLATGYNIVDVAVAAECGIPVANAPGYARASTAQMVFALLLELATHAGDHSRRVREGRWAAGPDFCFWDYPLHELSGRTIGIVGYGSIGKSVAVIARAFGMSVIIHSRSPVAGEENVALDDLFARADVVTLHCPLTPQTQQLVNAARLARMKPGAFLINTGRGPLVDEAALADALNAGRLAGAGIDVLSQEPPSTDNPLLSARNCIITPHIAWATLSARQRLMDITVANVQAFLAGRPQNLVGPPVQARQAA